MSKEIKGEPNRFTTWVSQGGLDAQLRATLVGEQVHAERCGCPACARAVLPYEENIAAWNAFDGRWVDDLPSQKDQFSHPGADLLTYENFE